MFLFSLPSCEWPLFPWSTTEGWVFRFAFYFFPVRFCWSGILALVEGSGELWSSLLPCVGHLVSPPDPCLCGPLQTRAQANIDQPTSARQSWFQCSLTPEESGFCIPGLWGISLFSFQHSYVLLLHVFLKLFLIFYPAFLVVLSWEGILWPSSMPHCWKWNTQILV